MEKKYCTGEGQGSACNEYGKNDQYCPAFAKILILI